MNLLIYGAGGHAKVVATAAYEISKYKKIYFLDSTKQNFDFLANDKIFYLNPENISSIKSNNYHSIIAIGDNKIRMRIVLEQSDDNFISIESSSAYISSFSKINQGVFVASGAIINSGSIVGPHSIVNTGSIVEHDCEIGSFCHIAPNTALGGNVVTGQNVFIGGGSFINPNISICDDVIIGSGSVVINDITEAGVYVGAPAKKIK
tara:strand:+ start:446 stop:1063 length:618 start_codon:yes stop_codon:yes gene_type:complete